VTLITRVVPLVVGWLAAWWLLWRRPVPRPLAPGVDARDVLVGVSVVVPARDEAATLPVLLPSLTDAIDAGVEVVVVDDHSTDATGAIARAAGVRVVDAPDLPDGWAGKPHACALGAAAATGSTLVFLDADTRLEPDGLARIVAEQRAVGGLLSVQPFHEVERVSDRWASIFNIVGVMGVGCATAPPRPRVAGAFGPCVVTSRTDYETVGGHAAVRGAVVEDVALAERYRSAGLPVDARLGRGSIAFRMYPEGPRQLVEGFTKNFAGGAGAIPWWRTLLIFVWITGLLLAGWTLFLQIVGAYWHGVFPAWSTYLWYGLYGLQLTVLLRRVGRFGGWTAWGFPLYVTAFVLIFLRSIVHTLRGTTTWRGRTVRTRGA
jgi:glycosyltransferase involved in cell wall biosynthesis